MQEFILTQIRMILSDTMFIDEQVDSETTIKDLGLESLDEVALLIEIEKRLEVVFPDNFQIGTIGDLVNLTEELLKARPSNRGIMMDSEKIRSIINWYFEKRFPKANVSSQTKLKSLGLNSKNISPVLEWIEVVFGFKFSEDEKAPQTIEELIQFALRHNAEMTKI